MTGLARLGRLLLGVLLALLLELLPLPPAVAPLRPMLLPMVLAYAALSDVELPVQLTAFCAGLATDLLLGSPLGEHALALVGLVYLLLRLRSSLVVLPPWQTSLVLVPIWGLYAFALFWLDGLEHHPADPWLRWTPVFSTALLWPILSGILSSRRPRRRRSDLR